MTVAYSDSHPMMYVVSPQWNRLGSGWQFNRLFGHLNHGLNHFTELGDDLGHDLGGQITY